MSLPPYSEQPGPPPGYYEPTFDVRLMKHTGLVIVWLNTRHSIRGTQAQCEAALRDALTHNLVAGWWSIGSLVWNPISLLHNVNQRKNLRAQVDHARAYAAWAAHYGQARTAMPPPPLPPPPVKRSRWWLWLVIPLVVVLVLFLALLVLTLVKGPRGDRSVSTSPPYPANLSIPERLLSPAEVAPIVGAPSLATVEIGEDTKMYGDEIVDTDCASVRFVATKTFYDAVPWRTVKRSYLRDPPEGDVRFVVEQGVVRYRSDERARQSYAAATDKWNRCAGRTINARQLNGTDTEDKFWTIGPVVVAGDTLTTSLSIPDVADYVCQRGLRVRSNQLFDVEACGYGLTPTAVTTLLDELGTRNP